MLGHALDHHAWGDADGSSGHWMRTGTPAAWAGSRRLGRPHPGRHHQTRPGPAARPARSLWLYTTIQQANRQKNAGQPDQAAQSLPADLA